MSDSKHHATALVVENNKRRANSRRRTLPTIRQADEKSSWKRRYQLRSVQLDWLFSSREDSGCCSLKLGQRKQPYASSQYLIFRLERDQSTVAQVRDEVEVLKPLVFRVKPSDQRDQVTIVRMYIEHPSKCSAGNA